jgi:hypothetical protein
VLNDGDLSLLDQNRKSQFRQNRSCIYGLSCREKLKDERTGLTHDFTRKDGVAHSEIVSNLDIEIDRSQLWNLAEKSENRKDARTAREWVIALPDELDADQRKDLAKAFAKALVDRYGVIADLAIHEPSKGGNDKNHHAHIMLTTRKAELDPENNLTLTTKQKLNSVTPNENPQHGYNPRRHQTNSGNMGRLSQSRLEQAGYRKNRPPQLCRSEQRTTSHHS